MPIVEEDIRRMVIAAMLLVVDEVQSATELAEYTAEAFNHSEWLDDETHWIWDEALIAYLRYHRED